MNFNYEVNDIEEYSFFFFESVEGRRGVFFNLIVKWKMLKNTGCVIQMLEPKSEMNSALRNES